MVYNSCCIYTHIIVITFSDGTSCDHVVCVDCTTHVGVTATNFLAAIITGSVDCCLCGDMSTHIIINPLITKGINANSNLLEIHSVDVLLGECGGLHSFIPHPFTWWYDFYVRDLDSIQTNKHSREILSVFFWCGYMEICRVIHKLIPQASITSINLLESTYVHVLLGYYVGFPCFS